MIKILFICHGNICRSPMAEFILRDMLERTGREGEIAVSSAAVSREDCAAAERRGLLERAYQGSAGKLVAAFLKDEKLTPQERETLAAFLNDYSYQNDPVLEPEDTAEVLDCLAGALERQD